MSQTNIRLKQTWHYWSCLLLLRLWTTNPTKTGFYDEHCNDSSTQLLHSPTPFPLWKPSYHPRSSFPHIRHLTTWNLLVMGTHTLCVPYCINILIGHLGLPQHWRIQRNKYHSPVSLRISFLNHKRSRLCHTWKITKAQHNCGKWHVNRNKR